MVITEHLQMCIIMLNLEHVIIEISVTKHKIVEPQIWNW